MLVYRISREEFSDDLTGIGAKLYGGRWNEKGIPVLYTCEFKSLTVLELLVHTPKEFKPPKYVILTIEIPDQFMGQIENFKVSDLPKNWNNPIAPKLVNAWGTEKIINQKLLGFKVPSVILKSENNIVLNPAHQNFSRIKIVDKENYTIDERLIK